MIPVLALFGIFLLGFLMWQIVLTRRFCLALRRNPPDRREDDACPTAAVVLCLRGRDPSLDQCLGGLLSQDYPRFKIRVVVDHETDPALASVEEFIDRDEGALLRTEILEDHLPDCSLKCGSLVQTIRQLDESTEVIALIDADTIPYPNWLRDLVAPFSDPEVKVVTGTRWYHPADPGVGSVMRHFWNASASVQMAVFGIPWGGSLALRSGLIRQPGLLDHWSRAFCEDTMLPRFLAEPHSQLALAGPAIMVNREKCRPREFFSWSVRQLLTVRLYHGSWFLVSLHGILTGLVLPFTAISLGLALSRGTAGETALILAMSIGYAAGMAVLWRAAETSVGNITRARGESDWTMTPRIALSSLVAIPLLLILHPMALVAARFLRRIRWRQITYRVRGPWSIRPLSHAPYSETRKRPEESL